jgi:hypothetical protein
LRRQAKGLGGYEDKAEFARVFKVINPPVVPDPEPDDANQFVGEQYCGYALEIPEEAFREPREDGQEDDKRVLGINMCLQELRECIATRKRR